MNKQYMAFGDRLRQLRIERGLSQEELAQVLGTSKQVISRFETNQRAPKLPLMQEYAEKLGVSIDYFLGDTEEETNFNCLSAGKKSKYFYKIFIEVTERMGLDIPGIVRVTGLTDAQVRTIIFRNLKEAPLPLALQLTDTLGVPLEVWAGDLPYTPTELSPEAREIARAYDQATLKDKNTARLALDLEPVAPPKEVQRE